MRRKVYFNFVNIRKYLREDKETGEREIVSITNRNALPVERHMELLNLNAEGRIYLKCVEDNFDDLPEIEPFSWTCFWL